MGVEDEYLRLLLEVKGANALIDLKAELANVGKEETNLKALYDQNAIAEDLLEKETRRLAQAKAELNSQVNGLTTGTRNMGRATLEASRGLEDLQYGVAGVLNNIPTLVQSLGGGAGLAGVISLVAVGLNQLVKHWPEVIALFGDAKTEVDGLKGAMGGLEKQIEELSEKPVKLAVDVQDLNAAQAQFEELKQAQADFDAAGKKVGGHWEKESGRQIDELLSEEKGGQKGVRDKLRDSLVREAEQVSLPLNKDRKDVADLRAENKELEKAIKGSGDHRQISMLTRTLRENEKEIAKKINEINLAKQAIEVDAGRDTGKMLGDSQRGDLTAQKKLAEWLRKAGLGNLAQGVEQASPEEVERRESEANEFDRGNKKAREGRERREKAEKEHQQELDKRRKRAEKELDDLTDRQIKDQEEGERDRAKGDRKDLAALNKRVAAVKKKWDETAGDFKGSGLDEQAQLRALQYQMRGGNQEQVRTALTQDLAREVGRARPDLNLLDRDAVARRIAAKALDEVEERETRLQAQGLNVNLATQRAMAEVLNTMREVALKMQQQEANAARLGEDAVLQRREIQQRGAPRLNFAGP